MQKARPTTATGPAPSCCSPAIQSSGTRVPLRCTNTATAAIGKSACLGSAGHLVQCSNQLYETCRAPRVLFGKGVSLALAHHAGDFPVIVVLKMHIRRIAAWQECYQRKAGLAQKRGGYVVPEEGVEEAARRVPLTLQ